MKVVLAARPTIDGAVAHWHELPMYLSKGDRHAYVERCTDQLSGLLCVAARQHRTLSKRQRSIAGGASHGGATCSQLSWLRSTSPH